MSSLPTHLYSTAVSLSLQITATRHAIKTDIGVAADVSSYCDILVMVGDPASNSASTLSSGMQV
jgi:hypothetical protein